MITVPRPFMWKGSMFIIQSSSAVVVNWARCLQTAIVEANKTTAEKGISPGIPLDIQHLVEVTFPEMQLITHVEDGYPQTREANGET